MKHLSSEELRSFLATDPTWTMQNGKLYQKRTFADFQEAFAFMTRVADIATQLDHHPEWKNIYNIVEIWLTTHDTGGITQKDLALAKEISKQTI